MSFCSIELIVRVFLSNVMLPATKFLKLYTGKLIISSMLVEKSLKQRNLPFLKGFLNLVPNLTTYLTTS